MGSTRLSTYSRATLIAGLALLFCLLAQLVSAGLASQLRPRRMLTRPS